jgi:hypothetical protein
VGLAAWAVSYGAVHLPDFGRQDFGVWYDGARALLAGESPYEAVKRGWLMGLLYPLPAVIATVPFAGMAEKVAGPIFSGVMAACFAFAVTRESWFRLTALLSASFLMAVVMGHWTPLLVACMVSPAFSWAGAIKPNLGLAALAYRPSVAAALTMLAVAALSLLVYPQWPWEWLASVRASPGHFAPITAPGGFLMLVALTRWRRPEARLLLALSVLPSSPIAYEALPLFLVPNTRREMIVLAAGSHALFYAQLVAYTPDVGAFFRVMSPATLWLVYVPALALVLLRPNVGHATVSQSGRAIPRPVASA